MTQSTQKKLVIAFLCALTAGFVADHVREVDRRTDQPMRVCRRLVEERAVTSCARGYGADLVELRSPSGLLIVRHDRTVWASSGVPQALIDHVTDAYR